MDKKFLCYTLVYFVYYMANAQNSFTNFFRLGIETDTIFVNTATQKKIFIIADSTPIYKNALIKVYFPKLYNDIVKDGDLLATVRAGYTRVGSISSNKKAQIISIKRANAEFVNIPSSAFGYEIQHDVNQSVVTIQMLDTLPKGDTLLINYGANGTATYTNNSGMVQEDDFKALVNNNTSAYTYIISKARIFIVNSTAKSIYPVLQTTAKPNQTILLKLIIHDLNENRATNFTGTIALTCSANSATIPSSINITPADSGKKDIYFTIPQKGVYTVTAQLISGNANITGSFVSNPVNISDDSMHIYFGDFHTHTKFSRDGYGSNAYNYARNGIGLDFYCGTDHSDDNSVDTFGIHKNEWDELKQEAVAVNQPGRFVAFLGYENSLDNPSGHYNFIYDYPDSLINAIPVLAKSFTWNIQAFWQKLDIMDSRIKVLTIPHHTGKLFNPPFIDHGGSQFGGIYKNNKYKRLLEIYSGHGLCEYYNPNHGLAYERFNAKSTQYPCYAQDAWAMGEKLGIISSTDSHNGKGEAANVGLAAIYSDTLVRSNLFDNLYNRHTYATTGIRSILKFFVQDKLMGEEFTLPCDSFPRLRFEINATDDIDFIEILKWDFKNGTYSSGQFPHPQYSLIKRYAFNSAVKNFNDIFLDITYKDSSLYYMRYKQKNKIDGREAWAWSSPIWVNKSAACSYGQILNTDSIFNFSATYEPKQVNIVWSIKDELLTDYYIIERSTDSINFIPLLYTDASNSPYLDTSYSQTDSSLYAAKYCYRIKQVFYNDSFVYSPIICLSLPFKRDSVLSISTQLKINHVANDWTTQEFYAQQIQLIRFSPQQLGSSIYTTPALGDTINMYMHKDFNPLEDTSYYRALIKLKDGSYTYSKTDTLVFKSNVYQHLNAVRVNNAIQICFDFINQYNTDYFVLTHSIDSIHYAEVLRFNPNQGNFFDTLHYCVTDTAPYPGKNYYKITTVLFDGTQLNTPIIRLDIPTLVNYHINDDIRFDVLGNPASEGQNEILVKTKAMHTYSGSLSIYDVTGRLMHSQKETISNHEAYLKLPIYTLESGQYFIVFQSENNIAKTSFSIVHDHK